MSDTEFDLDAFGTRLEQEREQLLGASRDSAESRRPVTLDQQSVGRLSRMDAMQGQAMRQAEEGRRRERRQRIDAALARIDTGDYGFCLRCAEPIARPRLEFDPATPMCVGCATGAAR